MEVSLPRRAVWPNRGLLGGTAAAWSAPVAALLLHLLVACGGPSPRPDGSPDPTTVEMDPVVIEQVNDDPLAPTLEAYDATALFERAQERYESQAFDEAEGLYAKLLRTFPDSRYVFPALYNHGLCLEQLRQYGAAAARFRRYLQRAETLRDRRDGQFRWGYNLVRTGDHPTAVKLYSELLDAPDLSEADRAEVLLRRGTSLAGLKQFGEAERDLKRSIKAVAQAYDGVVDGNELLAEAHFQRGAIYQQLFRMVSLQLPIEKMREDLGDKVRFFRQSQSSYIDSLNVRNSYWAVAAGLRLGEIYEEFYRHILQADVPDEFDKDTKRHYFKALKKRLQPLIEQALVIYEKNITMSQRLGAQNEWVDETEGRVARLRLLLQSYDQPTEDHAEPGMTTDSTPNHDPEAAKRPSVDERPIPVPVKPPKAPPSEPAERTSGEGVL